MANVAQLKRMGKGEPPARSEAPKNTANPPRDKSEIVEKPVALQLKVPEAVAEAFAKAAGDKLGYKKGSKSLFFIELFEAYQAGKLTR